MGKWKTLLQIVLTVLLFVWIFRNGDMNALYGQIRSFPVWAFVASLILIFAVFLLPATINWKFFRQLKLPLPLLQIYSINITSFFYTLVLPGDIGGGAARYLKFTGQTVQRHPEVPNRGSKILLVMGMERFLMLYGASVLLLGLLFVHPLEGYESSLFLAVLGLLLTLGIILVTARKMSAVRIHKLKILPQKLREPIASAISGVHSFPASFLASNFVLAVLFHLAGALAVDGILIYAMDLPISVFSILPLVMTTRLLRMVPITYAGFGIREGMYPLFLTAKGLSYEQALLLGVLGSVLTTVLGLLGGVLELILRLNRTAPKPSRP